MGDPYEYRDQDRDYFEGRDYYDPYRYYPERRNPYYDNDYYDNDMYDRGYTDRDRYGSGRRYDSYESPYYYGTYSGYGPRNYTPSDDLIRDDINERLTQDGRIDATDVRVDVTGGVAELSGSVDDRQQKRIAERIADSVSGVWDVHNHLAIRHKRHYHGFEGTASRSELRPGMEVVGSQGEPVGTVKEVRDNDFLVDRPAARDFYVPYSACNVPNGQVRLNVRAADVDRQGWKMPELFGTPTNR